MEPPERSVEAVNERLVQWRQGDAVVGEHWFLSRADPHLPLTEPSREACDPATGNTEGEVPGFAVLTQTCDLVRDCESRPFVELSPLFQVDDADFRAIERGRMPRFAVVPALAESRLVADLDRVMTMEKAIVAGWTRVPGCRTDEEARLFAKALARKRERVAFPDDFVRWVRPLQKRLSDKHDKQSHEGKALRALREVRVRAAPAWNAPEVELLFFFIREDGETDFEGTPWSTLLEAWLNRVKPSGRFSTVEALVQTLDELTARDYVESDLLDLGYLSDRPG